MSILNVPEVTPSRVKGIVRYLLQARGRREKRETLETVLSPTALVSKGEDKAVSRSMVKLTIRECIKMGLLEEDDEKTEITINSKLNFKQELSSVLSQLLLSAPEYAENRDFSKVLAWYLNQDFADAPGNWSDAEHCLRKQLGQVLGLNDARFGQFEDWSCYLGFCWRNVLDGKQVLVPDPTVYLRQNLKNIFENQTNQQIPLGEVIERLGKYCPVFETGEFREEIEQQIELRESNYLSSVTSIALRRLEDEGIVKLERLSDTSIWVLNDGSRDPRVSHITYLKNKTLGGQL